MIKPTTIKLKLLHGNLMGTEYGYSLVEDYPSLFQLEGMNKNNPEYIFVIPSSQAGPNTSQWLMMAMPPDSDSPVKGWGTVQSSWWFYDTFEATDTRKTYLITEYVSSDDNHAGEQGKSEGYYGFRTNTSKIHDGSNCSG